MEPSGSPGGRRPAVAGATVPPRFAVLRRSTLPEEIANRLLALIRAQELRPGDKLPPERTLAATMSVSRPVLREALRALAIMKVVDIRQGAGTYITALEPQQLVSHLDLVFSKDTVALTQLLEARRVVEVGNARLAALRAGDAQVEELDRILVELERAVEEAARFSELDIEFHDVVCATAGNFVLGQFMTVIDTLGRVSRERTGASRAVREVMLRDHHRIVAALKAHDPDAAGAAMQAHLDHVQRALTDDVGGEPGAAGGTGAHGSREPGAPGGPA